MNYLNEHDLDAFINMAIKEDIGDGDHTSLASIPANARNKAELIIKQAGVIAGLSLARRVFLAVDPDLTVIFYARDGDFVREGDKVLEVEGKAQSILLAERLVLNFMQRMSGIASYTKHLVSIIEDTGVQLLDTRKTTPGLRMIEKWAVKIGGGGNHRFGLFDMILLKDNHIDFAGGIKQAIEATKKYLTENQKTLKIEIETRTLEEVKEVLQVGGVDRIMLDNMDNRTMKEAVYLIGGKYQTEASGGITESNLRAIAECGVDFISIGALTHSVMSLDMSLKAVK